MKLWWQGVSGVSRALCLPRWCVNADPRAGGGLAGGTGGAGTVVAG